MIKYECPDDNTSLLLDGPLGPMQPLQDSGILSSDTSFDLMLGSQHTSLPQQQQQQQPQLPTSPTPATPVQTQKTQNYIPPQQTTNATQLQAQQQLQQLQQLQQQLQQQQVQLQQQQLQQQLQQLQQQQQQVVQAAPQPASIQIQQLLQQLQQQQQPQPVQVGLQQIQVTPAQQLQISPQPQLLKQQPKSITISAEPQVRLSTEQLNVVKSPIVVQTPKLEVRSPPNKVAPTPVQQQIHKPATTYTQVSYPVRTTS